MTPYFDALRRDGALYEAVSYTHLDVYKRQEQGAVLKNCIIMQDSVIGPGAKLDYIICDKDVSVDGGVTLAGSPKLPLVVPKGSKI